VPALGWLLFGSALQAPGIANPASSATPNIFANIGLFICLILSKPNSVLLHQLNNNLVKTAIRQQLQAIGFPREDVPA
jgi:hypothetical protein